MGLAGTKTRRKLAFDPNNTKWSRDETTFGQKILRSQGWEPGQFLGAQDASHADLHSAASAAPIRITLKDDTLGLGAKVRQKQSDECTGLDVFKDLLGRLNGKSDDTIKKEQTLRSEIKTSAYVERKYGLMRFVKGGLLVGDQMSELLNKEEPVKDEEVKEDPVKEESKDQISLAQVPTQEDDETSKSKKEKKSKKRKAEESESPEETDVKKEKKKKKRSKEEPVEETTAGSSTHEEERKARKEKKKSKKSKSEETPAVDDEESKSKKSKKRKNEAAEEANNVSEEASDSKKKQKKEKKEKKEKKRKQRDATESSSEEAATTDVTMASTPTTTPAESGTSTPQALSTRHFVRSRNIASKRKALDAAALAQIFMVKPV
ncbi:Pin2-interacting protein X1 [Apiospora rasikravindrae]|uniref:PinX1-related protein 1 n=1 Tax=Apiospora rasikravindrae TaxID=990691 RepID=A0ABR1U9L5_9PEZI